MIKKLLLVLTIFPITVSAYENEYFNIEINDSYSEAIIENNTYTFKSKENDSLPQITITIDKNSTTNKQDVKKYNDEHLSTYKKTIENSFKDNLKDCDLNIKISNVQKEKLNNYDVLHYTVFWETKESFKYDMYQTTYLITTDNYVSTINIYSKEEKLSNDLNKILNTFKINDNKIENENFFDKQSNQILIVGIISGILGFLISIITQKKQ